MTTLPTTIDTADLDTLLGAIMRTETDAARILGAGYGLEGYALYHLVGHPSMAPKSAFGGACRTLTEDECKAELEKIKKEKESPGLTAMAIDWASLIKTLLPLLLQLLFGQPNPAPAAP